MDAPPTMIDTSFHPILSVRRSRRLSIMKTESGGNNGVIDLSDAPRTDDVPRLVEHNNEQGMNEGADNRDEISRADGLGKKELVKKEHGKKSKFFLVAEKECGKDGLRKKVNMKRKLESDNIKGKKETIEEATVFEKPVGEEGGMNNVGEETNGVGKNGDAGLVNKLPNNPVCKAPDTLHSRVALCSLHRLIPRLSPQQQKAIVEMGFGDVLEFKIKDVPGRLSYWLLDNFNEETCTLNVNGRTIPITRATIKDVLGVPMGPVYVRTRDEADFRHRLVIEWKRQFGKKERYYHLPLEQLLYTQTDGGWWFKLNFLVLYLTSIGETNKNATCNLRFLHCINEDTPFYKFDWCMFILECLVRTKKNWVRTSHYTGPIIVLLILYGSSLPNKTNKERVCFPLANNFTADMLDKLEAERFSTTNVDEVKMSVAEKFKKASELIGEADNALDDALDQNPHDKDLIQLRELRNVLFGSRTYTGADKDSPKQNVEQASDAPEQNDKDSTPEKEPFPYTQVYGTPSAYVAYAEEVELELSNKEKKIRSDNVNIPKFDLGFSTPRPATRMGGLVTPGTLNGVRSGRDVSGNADGIGALTPYNICEAMPIQSIAPVAAPRRSQRNVRPAEVLRSPYVVREVYVCGALSIHERRAAYCLFSGRFSQTDVLFKTDYVTGHRGVLETLCPSIKISSEVVDIFTKVLNHAELYRDPMKPMRKVFCDTSLMREWDVKDSSAKENDVRQAADRFIAEMMRILRTTAYRNLSNVDLVFFPIIKGGHFFVVCMYLKWKEVHILDNMYTICTDVSEIYGGVVDNLVARFVDFLTYQNHPAQVAMRTASRKILNLGCRTKHNFLDCGVFAMRHMETYMGGGEYDDRCDLRRESKAQKLQLDEIRMKYATKILLSDINQNNSEFEVEAEAYRLLPLEEQQRLVDGAFETVTKRVERML